MRPIEELSELVHAIVPERMLPVCAAILNDARFHIGIASSGHHPEAHQVPGGLVLHTLEVARAAAQLAPELSGLLVVAALYHDYGKIHEYEYVKGRVVSLPFRKRVGHVAFGWGTFIGNAASLGGFTDDEMAEVAHAILAHMGRREYGSPVEPATRLAFVLHTADMLSARGLA